MSKATPNRVLRRGVMIYDGKWVAIPIEDYNVAVNTYNAVRGLVVLAARIGEYREMTKRGRIDYENQLSATAREVLRLMGKDSA